ncbi:MarR family transcriptional regulator [Brachyspira aalborgi]|jgi:transcriptional regulator, MarR family|uniref:HTH-type transcriptional regulator MgrA n=1 Tax=Brachyspira aalborgi TaxID=29522 RepID=A0A5C8GER6_9SPIR|nr:MarR family transcriptional regulator [Brachyspira aalborgi]TXJ35097.1 MarR family transcriptional regulator [Brachyspira aalborgi]TXJ41765.1 MarR family transcriptional regulator [Brachyspira aalborgi]TXJ60503.1 MarR family transcriptional regulator [Brachyspira aalborgi]
MENFIIGKLIKQLHIALENNFNKFSKKYKLTSSQMDILIFLLHNEDKIVNQRDIENFLSLSNPTIAGTLLRLEKKGFIIRKISSKDKRYKEIYLTDKSRELKDIIFKYIRDNDNKMFSNMSEEEKENLKNIITKILNNIQK